MRRDFHVDIEKRELNRPKSSKTAITKANDITNQYFAFFPK